MKNYAKRARAAALIIVAPFIIAAILSSCSTASCPTYSKKEKQQRQYSHMQANYKGR